MVPAGQKPGTDVADGLMWLGPRLCLSVGRSGRHRRHISGIVRLPVVRPDLDHQAWEPTPLRLHFQQGFGAWLADVGRVLSCDETAGQESGNHVDRVEKNLQTKSHRGSGPSSPSEVGEKGVDGPTS